MKAVIFCSGVIDDYEFLKDKHFDDCLIISADGGIRHLNRLNIVPHVAIGDRDSATEDFPADAETLIYPTDKDYTDTHLCIDYAIGKGCDEIVLYGATGGRLDHEFSHYCLMAYGLSKGVRVMLCDPKNDIWMESSPFTLDRCKRKYISFFPYGGDVEGFSVSGLKYKAKGMRLSCSNVQASSNEFTDEPTAKISFDKGILIVMLCDDIK